MPGYSAQELFASESLEDWPDLDLVPLDAEPELDLPPLPTPSPEQEAA
jgi:hypothetical protein